MRTLIPHGVRDLEIAQLGLRQNTPIVVKVAHAHWPSALSTMSPAPPHKALEELNYLHPPGIFPSDPYLPEAPRHTHPTFLPLFSDQPQDQWVQRDPA